jgi:hypothetical protein
MHCSEPQLEPFGTATYHHSASLVTDWAKELSMEQNKPSMKMS